MPRVSKEQIRREMEVIRKLINVDNLRDYEIIEQLKIDERTFYRYKKRIENYEYKLWYQTNKDTVEYREAKFHKTLEDGYLLAKKIAEDPKVSALSRLEATKTMCILQAQLAKFAKDGTILYSHSQLPEKVVPIDSKEVTV